MLAPEAHRLRTKKARRDRMIEAQVRRGVNHLARYSNVGPLEAWQVDYLRYMIREGWNGP